MALFEISVETADKFYTWGWRASIIGAVITAIALIALMWGTRVRDRAFETQIAQTNLSAAEANERAANAELELAKLKTPRRLDVQQLTSVDDMAKSFPSVVYFFSVNSGDPEATNLMVQIGNALRSAGWNWMACPRGTVTTYPGNTPASCQTVLYGNEIVVSTR